MVLLIKVLSLSVMNLNASGKFIFEITKTIGLQKYF